MDTGIQKYIAFTEAVETGSFTRAAEKTHYSQSGISRMIADLEKEWQVTLLERGKSGVKLTSDGTKMLPYAKRLIRDWEALQKEVEQLGGLQSGLIRIGAFSSAATHLLPSMIREFQKDYPRIDYELLLGDYTEIEAWLLEGRIDCGFLRLPAHPELEVTYLTQDKLMAILPEDHPLCMLNSVPLKDLCSEPFMLLEKGAKAEVSEIFERRGLKPNVHFTTWDDYAIMAMVESGLGVSIVPELILKRLPYHIAAREPDIPAYRKIGFAVRSQKNVSVAVKRFMEYLPYR